MMARQRSGKRMALPILLVGVGLLAAACGSSTPHITLGQTEGHLLSINQMPSGMVVSAQPHESRATSKSQAAKYSGNPGCPFAKGDSNLLQAHFPVASVVFTYGSPTTFSYTGEGMVNDSVSYVPSAQSKFSGVVKKMDGCTRLVYNGSHTKFTVQIHQVSFPSIGGRSVAYSISGFPARSFGLLVLAVRGDWAAELMFMAIHDTVSIHKVLPIARKAAADL